MNDFLTNMAAKAFPASSPIQPRLASRFEVKGIQGLHSETIQEHPHEVGDLFTPCQETLPSPFVEDPTNRVRTPEVRYPGRAAIPQSFIQEKRKNSNDQLATTPMIDSPVADTLISPEPISTRKLAASIPLDPQLRNDVDSGSDVRAVQERSSQPDLAAISDRLTVPKGHETRQVGFGNSESYVDESHLQPKIPIEIKAKTAEHSSPAPQAFDGIRPSTSVSQSNGSAPTAPTVKVTIGRIEVRAVSPPKASPRSKRTPNQPKLSLEDYLKKQSATHP